MHVPILQRGGIFFLVKLVKIKGVMYVDLFAILMLGKNCFKISVFCLFVLFLQNS